MSEPSEPYRVCFVCLGNICRSPTAEAVMHRLLRERGLEDRITVESAGTGSWHIGDPPDERATAEAARRGVAMVSRAQQFVRDDLDRFDLVIAMDRDNDEALHAMVDDPADAAKIRMLREFALTDAGRHDVPDPYFGGTDGFADVFDLIDDACRGLLAHLESEVLAR